MAARLGSSPSASSRFQLDRTRNGDWQYRMGTIYMNAGRSEAISHGLQHFDQPRHASRGNEVTQLDFNEPMGNASFRCRKLSP